MDSQFLHSDIVVIVMTIALISTADNSKRLSSLYSARHLPDSTCCVSHSSNGIVNPVLY